MKLGLEEAGSDEFSLLHDSVRTYQLTVQLIRRHTTHDTAHNGMQTNNKTPFLVEFRPSRARHRLWS